MESNTIVVVREGIEIEISRKKMKNLRLTVNPPNGKVKLSVPSKTKFEIVEQFILSKICWIKQKKMKYENRVIPKPKEYISGESIQLYGREYQLMVIETHKKQRIEIKDDKHITMLVRPYSTIEKRHKLMMEFYRSNLKEVLPLYINKWEAILGVEVREFNVKKMKTKWGTCNITKKRIWINLEFAKLPIEYLEYITVHEMIHLLEGHHNKRFYKLMDDFYPGWKNIKKRLTAYGISI